MIVLGVMAAITLSLCAFVAFSVACKMLRGGGDRVRLIREEGGGIAEMISGELQGGQRTPSSNRANGLYMRASAGGKVVYTPKSMVRSSY